MSISTSFNASAIHYIAHVGGPLDGTYLLMMHFTTLSIFTSAIVGGKLGGNIGEVDETVLHLSHTC